MRHYAFSKIWLVIIGLVFVVGGILVWQYWDTLNQIGNILKKEKDVLAEIKRNINKVKTVHTETKIEFLTKIGDSEPIIEPEESFSEDFDFANRKYQQKTMGEFSLGTELPKVVILDEDICRDVFFVGWICGKEGDSIPSTIPDSPGEYITFSKSNYPEGWDFTKKAEKIEKDLGIEEINGTKAHRYKVTLKKEPYREENFSKFSQYFYKHILGFGDPEELEKYEPVEGEELKVEGDKIRYVKDDREVLIPLPLDLEAPVMYVAVAHRPEEKREGYTIAGEQYTTDTWGIEGEIWVEEKTLRVIKERYVVEHAHFYFDPTLSEEENRKRNSNLFFKTTTEISYSDFNQDIEIEIPEEAITASDYLKKIEKEGPIINPRYQKMIIDSERQTKLEDITEVLYWYYVDHNKYPVSIETERMRDKNSNVYKSLVPNYLSEDLLFDPSLITPKDPEFSYMYKSDGQTFELSFQLESSEGVYKITRGSNLCEEEVNPDSCYCDLGHLTLDPLFCKKCKEAGGMGLVNMCYKDIAFKTQDPKVCDEIDGSADRGSCYRDIALEKKDLKLCEKIEEEEMRSSCKREVSPPDLVITNVEYEIAEADSPSQVKVFFWITTHNQGLSDADQRGSFNGPITVNIYDTEEYYEPNEAAGFYSISILKAGETKEIKTGSVYLNRYEREHATVKIKIDSHNAVKEMDETNNEFIKKIRIKD